MNIKYKPLMYALMGSLVLATSACSTLRTHSDYDPQTRFDRYATFAWMDDAEELRTEASGEEYISPLDKQRIEHAIERELTNKAYRQLGSGESADFLVTYTVGARDRVTVDRYPTTYRSRWVYHWPYYYGEVVDVHTYTEGMLAIDIFDRQTMHPVWHGVARKRVTGADEKNADALIKEAVAAILSEFPPQ